MSKIESTRETHVGLALKGHQDHTGQSDDEIAQLLGIDEETAFSALKSGLLLTSHMLLAYHHWVLGLTMAKTVELSMEDHGVEAEWHLYRNLQALKVSVAEYEMLEVYRQCSQAQRGMSRINMKGAMVIVVPT